MFGSDAQGADLPGRLDRLRSVMERSAIDVIVLIPGANLRYITGCAHYIGERPIIMFVPREGKSVAVIPKLETALFRRHPMESDLHIYADSEGPEAAFASALAALRVEGRTIGVEGKRLRFFEAELIRTLAPRARLVDADLPLAGLRVVKDPGEVAAIRRAVEISEEALRLTLDRVRVGMSEREISSALEVHLLDLGAQGTAFPTIVRGGPNSALPHSQGEDYALRPGDPLLFDFGALSDGYCADITRTVFVGEPSEEHRAFYEAVRAANAAGRAAVRPGVTAESVDRAAREVLAGAGHEALIRHRTGHGLGLEVHEWPYIVEGNARLLEPGMVFTVEPGIYRIGEIGVRIEDDMLVTEDGAESLTTFTRDLFVAG